MLNAVICTQIQFIRLVRVTRRYRRGFRCVGRLSNLDDRCYASRLARRGSIEAENHTVVTHERIREVYYVEGTYRRHTNPRRNPSKL